MAIEIKDFLTEVLGKTYKMPADKVAELFNSDGTIKDDAPNQVLSLDQVRIQEFETREKTHGDNMYKKAQSEILDMKEKEIKEKFNLTGSKKKGLLDIIAEIESQAITKASAIDPAKITTHPEFIKMQDQLTAQVTEKEKEWKDKYETREKEINKEKTFSQISKRADGILSGFALPEKEELANNQKTLLYQELNKYNFQQNGDDYIITDSEGKVVNDQHGHRKNFDALVAELSAKYWVKKDGVDRQGTGAANNANANNNGAGAAKANKWKGKINNETDLINAMSQPGITPEDRIEMGAALEEASKVV